MSIENDRHYLGGLSPEMSIADIDPVKATVEMRHLQQTGYEVMASSVPNLRLTGSDTILDHALHNLVTGDATVSENTLRRLLNSYYAVGPYAVVEKDHIYPGIALWKDLREGLRKKQGDISWGILGKGTIGGRVIEQLKEERLSRLGLARVPDFVVTRKGVDVTDEGLYSPFNGGFELPEVDVLFVATPGASGEKNLAHPHIVRQLQRRGIVVTAEKASLGEHFAEYRELSDDFLRMGFNATVGGGTRFLDTLRPYTVDVKNINELHMALNGTLAFFMSKVAQGVAGGVVVDQALALKYAEPNTSGLIDVLREEATSDVPRKLAVVYNTLLAKHPEYVFPDDFAFELSDGDIKKAVREAHERRFVVSIFNNDRLTPEDKKYLAESYVGGFVRETDSWTIIAGYLAIKHNPATLGFGTSHDATVEFSIGLGPDNQDGVYRGAVGPGAGPKPTANTMLDDAVRLVRQYPSL